jgi:putative redox protein
VDTLLGALAACSAIDVQDYLAKRRTPPTSLTVTVSAERRAETPRRVMSAHLGYAIEGSDVEPAHAARAVALSLAHYCSVSASLATDLAITTSVVVNGEQVSSDTEPRNT